jgi:putative ABC transport system permease protein
MILGNILRSNIVALERFYSAMAAEQDAVIHAFMAGATRLEAVRPFLKPAVQGAIAPHIAVVATMGLVSLPGMMTGQILGGALPEDAVAYQVMIMVAIVFTASLSTILALLFSLPRAFDRQQRLRGGLFLGK